MSDAPLDPDVSLPFPIEFVIRDIPRSHQSSNARANDLWKRKVAETASQHANTLTEWFVLDRRPLAATILYFPPGRIEGDADNIVKLIVDGMTKILYPDDQVIERVMAQKFEPGLAPVIESLTPTLKRAVDMDRPVIYIRIDDDLGWRRVE